jgi:hypothetical protein
LASPRVRAAVVAGLFTLTILGIVWTVVVLSLPKQKTSAINPAEPDAQAPHTEAPSRLLLRRLMLLHLRLYRLHLPVVTHRRARNRLHRLPAPCLRPRFSVPPACLGMRERPSPKACLLIAWRNLRDSAREPGQGRREDNVFRTTKTPYRRPAGNSSMRWRPVLPRMCSDSKPPVEAM